MSSSPRTWSPTKSRAKTRPAACKGKHIGTGIVRPNFWERARYYNLERELADALRQGQPMIMSRRAFCSRSPLGGVAFAFTGGDETPRSGSPPSPSRPARPAAAARAPQQDAGAEAQERRGHAQGRGKEPGAPRKKPTMRRRLEQAGFPKTTPRTFWIICGVVRRAVAAASAFFTHQKPLVIVLAAFGVGLGLPRWVLGFLTARRKKKFTDEFANAIDVIVRSVRSGLPTNEALRIVARESPNPVGSEFTRLVEGLKVGVTLEQGLKRMYRRHADRRSRLLRHRDDHPAQIGRQSVRSAGQPGRRAARPQAPARQDQGDVVGSQGLAP